MTLKTIKNKDVRYLAQNHPTHKRIQTGGQIFLPPRPFNRQVTDLISNLQPSVSELSRLLLWGWLVCF